MLMRTQVQLTDIQLDALRSISARRQRSIADLVREGVDLYLQRHSAGDRALLVERAKAAVGQFSSRAAQEESNG